MIAEQKAEILYIEYQPSKSSQYSITKEFLAAVLATVCSSSQPDSNMTATKNQDDLSHCSVAADTYENDHQTFMHLPLLGAVY